jgi:hypothetical protein
MTILPPTSQNCQWMHFFHVFESLSALWCPKDCLQFSVLSFFYCCYWCTTVHFCPFICMCRRYKYTHASCVHKCVTETVECGTSHKYTSLHNFCSVKYYKHFTKPYCSPPSSSQKIHLQSKRSVYLRTFNSRVHFAFSFLRIVTLSSAAACFRRHFTWFITS